MFTAFIASIILLATLAAPARAAAPSEMDAPRFLELADNFVILFDSSRAMDIPYKDTGLTRLEMEKQIIRQAVGTLPELNWQAGLYLQWKGGLWLHGARQGFKPEFVLDRFDKKAYLQAIDRLPTSPSGPAMLQRAMMKTAHLLPLPGRTQVILFTDGRDSRFPGVDEPEPLALAQELAKDGGLCLTIVSSAQKEAARTRLAQMAAVNDCSQVIDFDTVAKRPRYLVDKLYLDNRHTFANVLFDFDRSFIRPAFKPMLNRLGRLLTARPDLYAVLSGFTDNIGTRTYNLGLSRRRAESVQRYLHRHFSLPKERLLLYWYGFAYPVADNSTPEGRQLNRRVTITLRRDRPSR